MTQTRHATILHNPAVHDGRLRLLRQVAQWAATLKPLEDLAGDFAKACRVLARLEVRGRAPPFIEARSLYEYDLSHLSPTRPVVI